MHNLAEIRAGLVARLERLLTQMEQMEAEQRAPLDDDLAEQAVEREDDEALDAQQRSAAREVKSIQQAITRLDGGNYGLCTACGVPIDAARLQAMPTAAHCIECERELGG